MVRLEQLEVSFFLTAKIHVPSSPFSVHSLAEVGGQLPVF